LLCGVISLRKLTYFQEESNRRAAAVRVTIRAALNLPTEQWYGLFDRKPLVDALLDRLQHHCITIRIEGPSLRTTSSHTPDSPAARKQPRKR
jgi:DNA replication protein DnaC